MPFAKHVLDADLYLSHFNMFPAIYMLFAVNILHANLD